MSDKTIDANNIKTQHIYSSNNDDSIMIGGDLIPDDTDMYPRMIGSEDAPFRDVFADTFRGCVEPMGRFGTIGANRPFDRIVAKDMVAETINGVAFPGLLCGYGWFVAHICNEGIDILRSSFARSAIDFMKSSPKPGVSKISMFVRSIAPATRFVIGQDVFVEMTQFGNAAVGVDVAAKTLVRRVRPYVNSNNQESIKIDIEVLENVSVDYLLIAKIW